MTIGVGVDEKDDWVDPWLLKYANYRQAGYQIKNLLYGVGKIAVMKILWAFHYPHVATSFLKSGSQMAASGYGERGEVASVNHLPEWI
ncbi:hypothetical protein E6O75_ATG01240 [Venturia nashicola]|uniref:Uncharacterized protein n=1 Tax=Venturia nashicola TaxID=86259 RepID=A0A4Z1PTY0_9PEZI|nr:hypothetical protein E6O75_ATG01240 [Venturia nashicola]